jgi:signal transduction histidine kinase
MNQNEQPSPNFSKVHELTIDTLYGIIAMFFFGTLCLILGVLFIANNTSLPLMGNIGYPLLAFFAIIYYLLLLDFVAHYSIIAFGIVITNYRKYKVWFFGASLILLVLIVGILMRFFADGNPYLESVVDVSLLVILALVIEIIRPIITPKIMEFIEQLQKKET